MLNYLYLSSTNASLEIVGYRFLFVNKKALGSYRKIMLKPKHPEL